jgi:hypothetical protein
MQRYHEWLLVSDGQKSSDKKSKRLRLVPQSKFFMSLSFPAAASSYGTSMTVKDIRPGLPDGIFSNQKSQFG